MKLMLSGTFLLATTAMLAQTPSQAPTLGLNPTEKLDELRRLANQAKAAGDLPSETLYLCQAATLDAKKFGKKCDHAKDDTAKALAQFQADLAMGRAELQRKDYRGALRDLAKITFGPNKAEAQQWMQQARIGLGGGIPIDPASLDAFNAARTAYERGDFDAVGSEVARIQAPAIRTAANQLLANISAYQDAMKQADAMVYKGDLKEAEKKYQIAATLQRNGPGRPQDRLREVQAAEAQAATKPQSQRPASAPMSPNEKTIQPPSARNQNSSSRVRKGMDNAVKKDALQANTPGSLDVRHAGGVASNVPPDHTAKSGKTEDNLKEGIADFYASQFTSADDAIGRYLEKAERLHAGAAHFYLGASLLAQALLASPKDQAAADALRQRAHDQFVLAWQLHYKPIEPTVSPKILAQWMQAGEQ